MEADSLTWIRVSHRSPCPMCGKPDNCQVSQDGIWVWCGRKSEGSLRENNGGQYLHRLSDSWRSPVHSPKPKPRSRHSAADLPTLASRWFSDGSDARHKLAGLLGVDEIALSRLGVGWRRQSETWSVPERDATGKVIGINFRSVNGDKKRMRGSKCGLTYCSDWDTGAGPVFLVEGASDTAALMTMDLNVIGRPSNTGGVDLLAKLLRELPRDCAIIVVGERDLKADGKWPGKTGAISTATKLAEALDRPIGWTLPPDDAKDSRHWLNHAPKLPPDRLASLFTDGLNIAFVEPPPRYRQIINNAPVIPLNDWREWMLRERIASLDRPGFYLDHSATGAGKSRIDFTLLTTVLKTRSA